MTAAVLFEIARWLFTGDANGPLVLQAIAGHCRPLQAIAGHCRPLQAIAGHCRPLQTWEFAALFGDSAFRVQEAQCRMKPSSDRKLVSRPFVTYRILGCHDMLCVMNCSLLRWVRIWDLTPIRVELCPSHLLRVKAGPVYFRGFGTEQQCAFLFLSCCKHLQTISDALCPTPD